MSSENDNQRDESTEQTEEITAEPGVDEAWAILTDQVPPGEQVSVGDLILTRDGPSDWWTVRYESTIVDCISCNEYRSVQELLKYLKTVEDEAKNRASGDERSDSRRWVQ